MAWLTERFVRPSSNGSRRRWKRTGGKIKNNSADTGVLIERGIYKRYTPARRRRGNLCDGARAKKETFLGCLEMRTCTSPTKQGRRDGVHTFPVVMPTRFSFLKAAASLTRKFVNTPGSFCAEGIIKKSFTGGWRRVFITPRESRGIVLRCRVIYE